MIEAMLMMRPGLPSATRCAATSRAMSQAPLRLVSTTWSQSSSLCSSGFLTMAMPELLTRMVTGPSSVSAAVTASLTLADEVTSQATGKARPPSPSISAASASRRSSRRAASATLAPARASTFAKCQPRPAEAPVTRAASPPRSAVKDMAPLVSELAARPVAQHEFLDLARRGLGERPEHHRPRRLEMREVLAAPGDDLGSAHLAGAGFQRDEGARRLAPFVVGARHHRSLHHLRMAVEHLLDL